MSMAYKPRRRGRPRRVSVLAGPILLAWSVWIAGCGPSGSEAKPPPRPARAPVVRSGPAEQPNRRPAGPVASESAKALPDHLFPFEARVNPFAPPKPAVGDRLAAPGAMPTADVKLLGLMKDTAGSMAVVDVDGRQRIVFAGTKLGSPSGVEGPQIVEIRESDIVVEQSGRQWIVSLPRP